MVRAAASAASVRVRFKEVKASRGKVVRAEPVATLLEQGRVHHVGAFPQLEDQMIAFTTHGYMGDGSPDRADAMIWALSELFPRVAVSSEARQAKLHTGLDRSVRPPDVPGMAVPGPERLTKFSSQFRTNASILHAVS